MDNDLDIKVTPLVEDLFYLLLSLDGKVSQDQGRKIYERIKSKHTRQEYEEAIDSAKQMIDNIQKYGYACNEWKNL